ncbi:hypothetical protein ACP4OV_008361 [Aristida adscensionis]
MGDTKTSVEDLLQYQKIVSRTFNSEEEGIEFYNSYTRDKGFSIRKSYEDRRNAAKEVRLRTMVCSRQGFRELKHMNREKRIKSQEI